MKKKIKLKANTLLLLIFLLGISVFSVNAMADKKATEGQNEADVEFYEPTPEKIKPPKPKPEKKDPIIKMLPKTGEKENSSIVVLVGISILGLVGWGTLQRKKVGGFNEN